MAVYEPNFNTLIGSIQEDDWVIYLKIFIVEMKWAIFYG